VSARPGLDIPMTFLELWSVAGLLILAMVTGLWLISLLLRDSSIVDIFWGTGFAVTAWVAFAIVPARAHPRQWLICLLVTAWGLRLSLHILRRNRGRGEDSRYERWRAEAGPPWWWRSFFKVFLLQGILLWIVSAPLLAAQIRAQPDRLTWVDYAAIPVWLIGFFFEAAGDFQLARFKANPANKGKVLQSGVWRYTRHPNYFGDAAQWWAYYLIALAAGGWWTIFSPILMTTLLMRVSGVTLLEKTLKEGKPGYKEYVETTSEFIPWFPRKKHAK
jgi:steroid 5-alpha reductase family enzyme